MAPKRSAQPPPPPPPPPAASSEETAGSEESEEEEIAHSPPPAAPKMTAPLLGQESEGSEEEEDDEEEEEEDEEEEEKVNHVAPPPATKNTSPPPPKREESETSGDDEEEETDDEAPHPKPAPIQVAAGEKDAKPSSGEDKKAGAPFERTWSTDDEIRILEALAAYRREHGTLPQVDDLAAALAGRLDNSSSSLATLKDKIRNLKRRYSLASKKGELPSKDHDRRLYDLSKSVWGSVAAAANGGAPREFGEMCELYPYLAEEVKALQREHQGLFKREFMMMDDEKARSLDAKIKKQRMHQLRTHNRRHDLTKELTKTLIDLVD